MVRRCVVGSIVVVWESTSMEKIEEKKIYFIVLYDPSIDIEHT